jgi:hypothetical protein
MKVTAFAAGVIGISVCGARRSLVSARSEPHYSHKSSCTSTLVRKAYPQECASVCGRTGRTEQDVRYSRLVVS